MKLYQVKWKDDETLRHKFFTHGFEAREFASGIQAAGTEPTIWAIEPPTTAPDMAQFLNRIAGE